MIIKAQHPKMPFSFSFNLLEYDLANYFVHVDKKQEKKLTKKELKAQEDAEFEKMMKEMGLAEGKGEDGKKEESNQPVSGEGNAKNKKKKEKKKAKAAEEAKKAEEQKANEGKEETSELDKEAAIKAALEKRGAI